tara:strand:+ start:24094 stop:24228 length:135 start_codon:yes stop_codon:yes gene_type:complete
MLRSFKNSWKRGGEHSQKRISHPRRPKVRKENLAEYFPEENQLT